ncbi:bacillithiol system redox-active protein YtxJ [Sporosarcina sp. YIM B06819]|uniref:bacillithiol system redox-active protein YtxJ n=1 Tax=Sporosarcina sp. YIM B06819 TaxID=3081769 RepID=UPI00298D3BCC|nr:bacillithiol system redox-active protein YtxJ [Sporosarcina sp. YIM B06819]
MKELQTSNDWQSVLEQSKETQLFVLKHSTTCPVSTAAYRVFDSFETDIPKYFLRIQNNRSISNEIESDLGVRHESPQLFLLKDGKALWQATHYAISKSKINKALENLEGNE